MIELATRRLTLRRFVPGDANAMTNVLCDPEVMRFSIAGVRRPSDVPVWLRHRIDEAGVHPDLGIRAVVERPGGGVIGYAGLRMDPARCGADVAELSYRLAQRCWGQGYATEAAAAIVEHGLGALRLPRIVAVVDPTNAASLRVVAKLQMAFERPIMLPSYSYPDHLYGIGSGAEPAASTGRRGRPLSAEESG